MASRFHLITLCFLLESFVGSVVAEEPASKKTAIWADSEAPDLAPLQVEFGVPEGEINHLKTFLEIARVITLPDDIEDQLHSAFYDPHNVDPEALLTIISSNRQNLEELDSLLLADSHLCGTDSLDLYQALTPIAQLLHLRVIAYLLADESDVALRHFLTVHTMTEIFSQGVSESSSWRLALQTQQMFYQLSYLFIKDRALKESELKQIASLLEKPSENSTIFSNLLKDHTAKSIQRVYQLAEKDKGEAQAQEGALNTETLSTKTKLRSQIALKPHLTASEFLKATQNRLSQLPVPTNQREAPQADSPKLLTLNHLGETLLKDFVDTPQYFERDLDHIETHRRMTQLYCALRRYHFQHRKLPKTLETLTPTYLSELPREVYTGKNFGYAETERLLWSIGSDLESQVTARETSPLGYLAPTQELEPTLTLRFPLSRR